jgi:hypothetical protein
MDEDYAEENKSLFFLKKISKWIEMIVIFFSETNDWTKNDYWKRIGWISYWSCKETWFKNNTTIIKIEKVNWLKRIRLINVVYLI